MTKLKLTGEFKGEPEQKVAMFPIQGMMFECMNTSCQVLHYVVSHFDLTVCPCCKEQGERL